MKRTFLAAVVLTFAFAVPNGVQAQTLDFEGLLNCEQPGAFYGGGGGSGITPGSLGDVVCVDPFAAPSVGGPDFGITFNGDAYAFIRQTDGGEGNHGGEPTPNTAIGVLNLFFAPAQFVMNVAAGFTGGLSFFYSSIAQTQPAVVKVWSGLDGTGVELGSTVLGQTPSLPEPDCDVPNPAGTLFCPFFPESVAFAGAALSVTFETGWNELGLDNITLGSLTPCEGTTAECPGGIGGGTVIPEPSTVVLLATGLVGIGAAVNRRRKKLE